MGLFNAIGQGLSAAGYAAGDTLAKGALMDIQNEGQMQRELRLAEQKEKYEIDKEQRKLQQADEQRTARVKRVDAEVAKMADETWTPEHQAAVDQTNSPEGRNIHNKEFLSNPRNRALAASRTGDLSEKDAAEIRRADIAEARAATEAANNARRLDLTAQTEERRAADAERKDATARYIAELRDNQQSKRLEVLISKIGAKDSDGVKSTLSFIDGARKELASDESNLRNLYKQELEGAKFEADGPQRIKAEYEPKFKAIAQKRSQVESDFNYLRGKIGLPPVNQESVVKTPATAVKPWEKTWGGK